MHTTKVEHITLLEEAPKETRFPQWLKDRANTWYTVMFKKDRYIGEIYEVDGVWRAFTICVDNVDGTLDGCVKFLINNK